MTADFEPTYCWSCGKPIAECGCDASSGYPPVPLPRFIPRHHLPSCGSIPKATLTKEDQNIVAERPCCACHQIWACTYHDWINGTCPHCGASGPNPDGTLSNLPETKLNPEYLLNNNIEFSIPYKNYPSNETLEITYSKKCPIKNSPKKPTFLSQYSPQPEDQD